MTVSPELDARFRDAAAAESLLDVVHGGDPVAAPLSTGVLEFGVSVS